MSSAAAARSPVARPCCGLIRRSADDSSSPFIATTPGDSPQRSASAGRNGGGGRASSRASLTEKENDASHHQRDAARTPNKPARYSTGGVAKSFMAPTISAASKAASPRKKVLGDRNNDPTHPAVPSSSAGDILAHAKPRGQTPPPAAGAPRRLRLSLDGPPLAAAPPVASSHGARCSLGGEAGLEEVEDPVRKAHHYHDRPADAAPPYDPKTNYLSPRPQFLRYRPNPRVELYRQTGVRRLEDGFSSSESSDETDIATTTEGEEGLSEEEHESSSPPAPASDATADTVTADVLAPEPAPTSPLPQAPTPEPEEPTATSPTSELEPAVTSAHAPAKKKRSSLRFLLVAPLALVLLMVASLVCVPPAPASPAVLNASLSKASEYFLSVQELHPVELPAWLKQWSSSSLDFVSSYWNTLASSREQEFFGPHIAANLSAAAGDGADRVGFYYSAAETRPMSIELEPISASILEQKMEFQVVDSASDSVAIEEDEPTDAEMVQESVSISASILEQKMEFQVVDSARDSVPIGEDEPTDAEMVQESVSITASILEQKMEFQVVDSACDSVPIEEDEPTDAEMVQESVSATSNGIEELNYGDDLVVEEVPNSEMDEEVSASSREDMASSIQDLDIPSQSEPEPEHTVDDMDVPSLQQDVQTDESEGYQKEAHVNKDQEAHHGQKLGSGMWSRYLDNFSKLVAGSVLAILVASAALAFLYMRQNQARVSSDLNETTEDQPAEQVEQVKNGSGSGSSEGHALAKSSHLQNPVVEETESIGGSGASQYSSSLSSGLSKRRKDKEEQSLQSLEPMSRRESTGTSSYGSFTTYEKIPAKKKNKEDEAMTPVRRSSRLRNQVKSPEA